jgi:hypothetical protein
MENGMSIDGNYGFVYCGTNDVGFGVFTVLNGRVSGADCGRGRYTGTVTEDAEGNITVQYSFVVAPGSKLVQGIAPQDVPYTKTITDKFPPLFGDGKPVPASQPSVTVMIRRLPEDSNLPQLLGFQPPRAD